MNQYIFLKKKVKRKEFKISLLLPFSFPSLKQPAASFLIEQANACKFIQIQADGLLSPPGVVMAPSHPLSRQVKASVSSPSPSGLSPTVAIRLPVSVTLSALSTSCELTHEVHILYDWLVSTQRQTLKVLPGCALRQLVCSILHALTSGLARVRCCPQPCFMCQLTSTLTMIPQAEALVTPPENGGTRGQGNVAGIELDLSLGGWL